MNTGNSSQTTPQGSDFTRQFSMLKKILSRSYVIALILLGLLYISTCVRQVEVQETGMVLRFGKIVRRHVDPGICIKMPWPIDKLVTVRTRSIETIQAGFGADPQKVEDFERMYGPIDQLSHGTLSIPYIVTGDKNILHLLVLVNYMINDPVAFMFDVDQPSKLLGLLVQSVILDVVSCMEVDQLLVSGRIELRDLVADRLSNLLEHNALGLDVLSVEIRNVRPPRSTIYAFNDVINAQEESREIVHQAEAYVRTILPEARAEALKKITDAEAYRNRTVESATGEAGRFELLAAEYQNHPEVTRERIRQDAIAEIYPAITKYVVGRTRAGKAPVNLRFLSETATETVPAGP
jgi:modulator of FtsH protease HflK